MANEFRIKYGLIVDGQATIQGITSSLFGTSSWAVSSSWAATASYVSSSVISGVVASASNASTLGGFGPSYYLNLVNSTGILPTGRLTGSYQITSSWSNYSLNSISSSWASRSISASNADTLQGFAASYFQPALVTGGLYTITSSWSINSVNSVSASSSISSSFATTASWARLALTSSYVSAGNIDGTVDSATSASFATTANFLNGFPIDNTGSISQVTRSFFPVVTRNTGSFIAVVYDYAVVSGSNIRSGTVFGSWVGSNVTQAEYTTVDVGDTSEVTMSIGIGGPNIQLSCSIWNTRFWNVRALARYI